MIQLRTRERGNTQCLRLSSTVNIIESNYLARDESKYDYDISILNKHQKTLAKKNYQATKVLSKTLQGSISVGKNTKTNDKIIVKTAEKSLHNNSSTIHEGREYKVQEDIIKEKELVSLFSSSDGLTELIDWFEDKKYFYFIQTYGGESLFDYAIDSHTKIKRNLIPLKIWKNHCRNLFFQMVQIVNKLHNKYNCVHLDISLENMLIKDVIYDYKNKKYISHGKIFFCDFGLAESLVNNSVFMRKFVGKPSYKSPEINMRQKFNAKKSDVFSLGVSIFMLLVGMVPFEVAEFDNKRFKRIIKYGVYGVLKMYGKAGYVDNELLELWKRILIPEKKRFTIDDVLRHPYVKNVLLKSENICEVSKIKPKKYSFQEMLNRVTKRTNSNK